MGKSNFAKGKISVRGNDASSNHVCPHNSPGWQWTMEVSRGSHKAMDWIFNLSAQADTTIINYSLLIVNWEHGQARKSTRGMPWHWEPTKDATSCDKPRGAANRHRSVDFRMGKPTWGNTHVPCAESIGAWGEPPEVKHLSRARKRHQPRFRK